MQKKLATPHGGWERSVSLSSFIILSTPIIFIHLAGKCQVNTYYLQRKEFQKLQSASKQSPILLYLKKNDPGKKNADGVPKALRQDTHTHA